MHSAKVHLHKYPTRDGTHVEVCSFNSLRDGGSKGKVVVQETRKKNHGAKGFGEIESRLCEFLELDMIVIY